jgi:hypothetical protein
MTNSDNNNIFNSKSIEVRLDTHDVPCYLNTRRQVLDCCLLRYRRSKRHQFNILAHSGILVCYTYN